MTSELIKSVSIEALLQKREAMVERLRTAAQALTELKELTAAAFGEYELASPGLECRRSHVSETETVTFLRPDLVEKMNEIIARHCPGALPPARG